MQAGLVQNERHFHITPVASERFVRAYSTAGESRRNEHPCRPQPQKTYSTVIRGNTLKSDSTSLGERPSGTVKLDRLSQLKPSSEPSCQHTLENSISISQLFLFAFSYLCTLNFFGRQNQAFLVAQRILGSSGSIGGRSLTHLVKHRVFIPS